MKAILTIILLIFTISCQKDTTFGAGTGLYFDIGSVFPNTPSNYQTITLTSEKDIVTTAKVDYDKIITYSYTYTYSNIIGTYTNYFTNISTNAGYKSITFNATNGGVYTETIGSDLINVRLNSYNY